MTKKPTPGTVFRYADARLPHHKIGQRITSRTIDELLELAQHETDEAERAKILQWVMILRPLAKHGRRKGTTRGRPKLAANKSDPDHEVMAYLDQQASAAGGVARPHQWALVYAKQIGVAQKDRRDWAGRVAVKWKRRQTADK